MAEQTLQFVPAGRVPNQLPGLHKDLPKARAAPDKTDGKRIVNFE